MGCIHRESLHVLWLKLMQAFLPHFVNVVWLYIGTVFWGKRVNQVFIRKDFFDFSVFKLIATVSSRLVEYSLVECSFSPFFATLCPGVTATKNSTVCIEKERNGNSKE